jgi:hypothetical protein
MIKNVGIIDMYNRNYDGRAIALRLQAQSVARNIILATANGSRIGGGSASNNSSDIMNRFTEGAQSMYMRGTGGGLAVQVGGGVVAARPFIPPPPPPAAAVPKVSAAAPTTPPKPVSLTDGPSRPLILAAMPEQYGFTAYLSPPAFSGKSRMVTYEYSLNGEAWVPTNNLAPRIRIYPLNFQNTYTFVVRAVNEHAAGANSNIVSIKPSFGDYITYIEGNGEFDTLNTYTAPYFVCSTIFNKTSTILTEIESDDNFGYFTAEVTTNTLSLRTDSTWATNIGGTSHDLANALTIDTSGNICVTGFFNKSAKINSFITTGSNKVYTELFATLTGGDQDAYVAKYDNFGKAKWATNINGTIAEVQGLGISADLVGNIYTTGMFISTVKLNNYISTVNEQIITSTVGTLSTTGNNYDAFVIKYNPGGVIMWATTVSGIDTEIGSKVSADADGNVYATGYFTHIADVNSYIGVTNGATTISSFGKLGGDGNGSDAYIVKYNTNGGVLWATTIGKSGFDKGTSIATDYFGNVYATGNYTGSININNYSTVSSGQILTSTFGTLDAKGQQDTYIVRYNSTGQAIWGTSISGVNMDQGTDITTDIYGNIYATGYFTNSTCINQFNHVANGVILTSTVGVLQAGGTEDAYVIKYDAAGVVQWATNLGATGYDQGNGISVDIDGNVYATGTFQNSTDIMSFSTISSGIILTSSIGTLTGVGGTDAYVVKYNSSGKAIWAMNIGGYGDDQGYGITTDVFGNVYAAGQFNASTFINVFSSIQGGKIHTSSIGSLISNGELDTHIVKISTDGKFFQNATAIPEPGAPIIDRIESDNRAIRVYFTAGGANATYPVRDYEYSFNNGVTFTSAGTITSPITISNLVNGTSYTVVIRAVNSITTSVNSNSKAGMPTVPSYLAHTQQHL